MERERWELVKRIVNSCLEMDPGQRESHLASSCAGDLDLIAEVRSLLDSHSDMGDFLATSALEEDDEGSLAGSEIGHYQVCEPIAEGGMGTVYRAVRASDFEKQVAIKLVKRGMDTDFILRRFRHERQILAALDHPNIARLLDGGAARDGRPYLVMEYIQGLPITEYSDRHALGVSERLQLFRTVCAAVQYAHQNLVVHRDLKPSNILVTAEGVPKLLDFGIAKLLEPDTAATLTSVRLMTPECASPEQVRGQPVTTASDIYSLGVLLYELLTGVQPYQFTTRTPEEIELVVCETDPKKPGAVRPLSGDLDNIVLKAMNKDPGQRYASAEQFSEDIGRYLEGLPVRARKATLGYRARKFAGRHKAASVAAALVALSLMGGLGATLREAHIARLERTRAERRFNDVRELANSLMFEVHDAIRTLPGSTPARKLIVDRALKYLDRLAQEAGNDNSLRRELATAYKKLGEVQGGLDSNLGDTGAAIRSFRKAVKLLEEAAAQDPSNIPDRRELAAAYDILGAKLRDAGDLNGTEECDRKALQVRQALAARLPEVEANKELQSSYYYIGLHRIQMGDTSSALEYFRRSLDASEKVVRAQPDSANNQRNLSQAHKRLGAVLIKKNQLADALDHYQKARAIDEKTVAANPDNASARLDLTFAYSDIGYIQREQGDLAAALASYRRVENIRAKLVAEDPENKRSRWGLGSTYLNIGDVFSDMGNRRSAVASYEKALQIRESLLIADPVSRPAHQDVAHVCERLGSGHAALAAKARLPEDRLALWRKASGYYRRARQIIAALKAGGPLVDEAAQTDLAVTRELSKCDAAIAQLTDLAETLGK